MTARDIYELTIKPLALAERLRLAAMILNDIPPQSLPDYKPEWRDEDLADFGNQGWQRAQEQNGG